MLLPLVHLATETSAGILLIYLALIGETWTSMLITRYQVNSGRWKAVSRSFRPTAAKD